MVIRRVVASVTICGAHERASAQSAVVRDVGLDTSTRLRSLIVGLSRAIVPSYSARHALGETRTPARRARGPPRAPAPRRGSAAGRC
jgi:hypothetical protein